MSDRDIIHGCNVSASVSTPLRRALAFGLPLLILVERGWARLSTPDFWAEDGKVFLAQAMAEGWRSVLHPMAGTFFTLERLIMLGSIRLMPLVYAPFLVCLMSITITAFVASRLARDDYAWLIPSPAPRLGAACVFCLLPGLYEMLGNLCNINWILFAWVALLGLKDPERGLTRRNLAVMALVAVSVGTSILLVPLFLWRVAWAVKRRGFTRESRREITAVLILLILGALLPAVFGGAQPTSPPGVGAVGLAKVWYDHIARLAVFTPWIGDRLTIAMGEWHPTGLYRALKVLFVIFFVAWTWRHRRDPRGQAVVALLLGVSTWTVLSSLTRVYAFDLFQHQTGAWLYECRYSFIMSFTGLLFWLTVLQGIDHPRLPAAAVGCTFLAVYAVLAAHRFNIDAYSNPRFHARVVGTTVVVQPSTSHNVVDTGDTHWRATVADLERSWRTGCPRAVTVLQYPDPWAFDFVSQHPVSECK